MEIWKSIKGFESLYEVSDHGRVRNTRGKIMATYIINSGYETLKFTVNQHRTSHLVHRLVATAFIPNPNKLLEVNHIDENKTNNAKNNLEWNTSSQNKQHSIASGRYNKIYHTKNSLGKKHLPNCTSKYHNVTWDKSRNLWKGCIRHEGKNLFQRRFKTEKEAALHVNWVIDQLGLTDRPKNIIKELE